MQGYWMHGDNMMARLNRATNSPAATMLMMRLLYWHKSGKGRNLDGQKWVPNSISDWAKETGLTFQQVRTAFKVIEEGHLAEAKIVVYQTRKTLHTRPTPRAEAISEGASEEEAPCCQQQGTLLEATSDGVASNTVQGCQQHGLQGDTQGENKQKDISEPGSSPSISDPETEGSSGMNMKDTLAKVKSHKQMHKPDSVAALEYLWKQKVAEETGHMVVLTNKDRGQLKHFISMLPANTAETVLGKVLGNWIGFAKRAETLNGAFNVPALPNVGFLLKHANVAAMMITPDAQAIAPLKPKAQEAPKALSDQGLQSIAQEGADPEISYEETLAILKGK